MSNYILTRRKNYFEKIGDYLYGDVDMLASLPELIAYDCETTGLEARKCQMFAIQIGTGKDNFLIDLESIPFNDVRPYIEGKILCGHNITFDLGFLYQQNFFPKKVRDTMIASKILHNGLPHVRHNFGEVMERELGIEYDKSEQKNIYKVKLSTSKAIQYCFNDVDRLLELNSVLRDKITLGGFAETYKLHLRYIRALAYMEQCGMPLSYERWAAKCESDKLELEKKKQVVIDYIYDNFPKYQRNQMDMFAPQKEKEVTVNLGSPKQMIPIFQALGINVENPEDPEKFSIQEDVIKKTKHEFVDIWLDMQSIAHDVSTFGESILEQVEDDMIYTSFNPILDTARISTRKGAINFLNFPANKKTRECIKARPGYKYIVCDYEGQETRTGADITEDAAMISSIVNGDCLHCAFTRVLNPELADLSDEEIQTHHKDKRQKAKAPRFCFQFGGGAYTLAQNEGIELEEAQRIEAAYKELHSGIYEWGAKKFQQVIEVGYIESTAGFKLFFPYFEDFKKAHKSLQRFDRDFWKIYREGKLEYKAKKEAEDSGKSYAVINQQAYKLYKDNKYEISQYFKKKSEYFKKVLNNPTQTTAAHQTKEAVCRIFEYIEEKNHYWKARISNTCHDEICMEVEDGLAEEYTSVVEKAMKEGGDKYLTKGLFKMDCQAHANTDWYTAKG